MKTFARLPWLFSALFGGFGLLAAGPGWWFLVLQHYRLATYLPVQARVIESRVVPGGNDAYEPLIAYSYEVRGLPYEGRRVLAIGNFSSSASSASRRCLQFPAGTNVTAWYSARNPAISFLSREVVFAPYFVVMLGSVFVGVGGYALFQSIRGRRRFVPPTRSRDGWFDLRQEYPLRRAFQFSVVLAIGWYAYCSILLGDYLILKGDASDWSFVIFAVIVGVVGVVWLVRSWRAWQLCHDFAAARLATDRDRFEPGGSVRLRLDQGISRHLQIEELSLGAVCMRSDRVTQSFATGASVTYTPMTVASSVYKRLAVDRVYAPGSKLSASCEFTLPKDAAPSTPPDSSIFPVYQWFFILEVAARDQPKLSVRFPITVQGRPVAEAGDLVVER